MALSVSQRIGGGFAMLCLLLLLIGGIAYSSFRAIDQQLHQVTQQATPLVQHSGQLLQQLLQSKYLLLSYLRTDNQDDLKPLEQSLIHYQQQFTTTVAATGLLTQSNPAGQQALGQIDEQTTPLFDKAARLFQYHRQHIAAFAQVQLADPVFQNARQELRFSLEDIILDERNYEVLNAARTFKDEVDYLSNQLTQLLSMQTLVEIDPHWDKILHQFHKINAQRQRLQQLLDTDNYRDIGNYWGLLSDQLRQPEQLFQSHIQSVKAKQQASQQLAEVAGLIDHSESLLQLFTREAQQLATGAETATEKTIERASGLIAMGSALALLGAAVLSLMLTRRIRHSLVQVVEGLNQVTQGDLNVDLAIKGQDEFSHLAASVNSLTLNLRELVQDIRTAVDDLQHNARASSHISQLALAGVANQGLQSSRVATTMTELEASAAEVAHNAEMTLSDVLDAEASLNTGRQLMQGNREAIGILSDQVSSSTAQIQQLQQGCESIGEIVNVIHSIAEQTNLLALNAAIEAARAGEQGRGFAVVADEVRSLASRTQGSTATIEKMVTALQGGARNCAATMTDCNDRAIESLVHMESSNEQFEHVVSSISRIRQMNAQVAQATQEQRATTQEISRSLIEINKVTEETAEGAKDTAQQSHTLTALAKQLDRMIGRFQI